MDFREGKLELRGTLLRRFAAAQQVEEYLKLCLQLFKQGPPQDSEPSCSSKRPAEDDDDGDKADEGQKSGTKKQRLPGGNSGSQGSTKARDQQQLSAVPFTMSSHLVHASSSTTDFPPAVLYQNPFIVTPPQSASPILWIGQNTNVDIELHDGTFRFVPKGQEEEMGVTVEDSHTHVLEEWSLFKSLYQFFIERVVDNAQWGPRSAYLDIVCETSHDRAWAHIASKQSVDFIQQLQKTSVVPELHHVEAVEGGYVVITAYLGGVMEGVPRDGCVPLQLVRQFLEHMVTLVDHGFLWITLDPDGVFFDIETVEAKLLNVLRASDRCADCNILRAAGHIIASLSAFMCGAELSTLEEISQRLLEEPTVQEESATPDSAISKYLISAF
ncbi:hypothetical protein AAF712_011391 [Marasmius tenuissimus]|uniref:Uncharacterized protein n=1 Tax=Marasmius tenuissimus TaxID=585030 RepID=A0ABR2ZLC2_9AGAR